MRKKIKKYGDSLVINFDKEEIEWFGFNEGDWIFIDDKSIKKIKEDVKNASV